MKKIIFTICIIGVFDLLPGGDTSISQLPSFLNNWEISVGSNYSQFISTPDPGHFGLNFGVYRNFNIYKKLNMKAGFTRSRVYLQARNKTIRTNIFGHWYLEHLNKIDFTYNFTLFNLFIDYPIISYQNFSFHPLLGLGYSLVDCDGNVKDIEFTEESWYRFPEADYDQYDEVLNIPDKGKVIHYGVVCKYSKLFFEFYYSRHFNNINDGGAYLKINERMHNFNTSIGFVF